MRADQRFAPTVEQSNDLRKILRHRVVAGLDPAGGKLGKGSQRIPGGRPRRTWVRRRRHRNGRGRGGRSGRRNGGGGGTLAPASPGAFFKTSRGGAAPAARGRPRP